MSRLAGRIQCTRKTKTDVLGEHPVFSHSRVVMPVHDSPDAFRESGKRCCESEENEEKVRGRRRKAVCLFGNEHLEDYPPVRGKDFRERLDDEK